MTSPLGFGHKHLVSVLQGAIIRSGVITSNRSLHCFPPAVITGQEDISLFSLTRQIRLEPITVGRQTEEHFTVIPPYRCSD